MRSCLSPVFLMIILFLLISSKPEKEYYNELYRPQFHFTPEKDWLGSPSGLVFYDGEYQLFYQHNPKGKERGVMHWGHAVSKNLVQWEPLPVAIYPDEGTEDEKGCAAFSGSAIVDKNNTLGLQEGSDKTLVAFYTSYKCGQRIAYSTDKGRTWEKYRGNPVIPYNPADDARDPKVFWYEPAKKWVMVLSRKPDGDEVKKGVSIYNSENLADWELKSHLPGLYEYPDLVELPVNNRVNESKWVLFGGDGSYLIGNFDGESFIPETGRIRSDYGKNYYATQTWNNIPKKDGRTIQIAWMKGAEFTDMPFNGQLTFPCEISLRRFGEGVRLFRQPVKEIELLHGKHYEWTDKNIIPGINQNIVKKVKGDCLHIIGTFNIKTSDNFGLVLRHGKKVLGTEIIYNVKMGVLSCLGTKILAKPVDGRIELEILLDRASIEIFVNGGSAVITNSFLPVEGNKGLVLFTNGGELLVEQLDIYEMKSAWRAE
ncbi:Sucrose-6-phosphate hydrolase (EC 3.2.1.B3) [hydrothermal vent metagenome]|uniref:Sucrose-6-phosphate hydrolase n=1 Tax=hydrothermal vent metagenome TaxID=652676 RepID=A0A3B0U053_9ZZZZ